MLSTARPFKTIVVAAAGLALVVISLSPAAMAASESAQDTKGRSHEIQLRPNPFKEWIEFNDQSVTPVVDDVAQSLSEARQALKNKEPIKAADAMRSSARHLRLQSWQGQMSQGDQLAAKTTTEIKQRLAAAADKLDVIASYVAGGEYPTVSAFDDAFDQATRDDLESRWLFSNVSTGIR